MKAFIFLLLVFFFNLPIFAQVSLDHGATFYTDSTETILCNGKFRKFYPGYIIKSSISFKAGKLHGEYHEYFENGLSKITAHYNAGLLEGEYIEYYPELNEIKLKTHSLNGVKHGLETTYDEVGEEIKTVNYEYGNLKE